MQKYGKIWYKVGVMRLHASYTHHRMFTLFLLLVCASMVHHGNGHTYYVKPSNSTTACPGKPCNTLNYYLKNEPQLFHKSVNTTLDFLAGIHILDGEQPVTIELVKNFTMIGSETLSKTTDAWGMPVPSSEIRCQGLIGFNITFSKNVSIHNLVLSKCGAIYHGNVNFTAALMIYQVFNLSISRIVVQNTTGYGVLGTNILGTSIITHSPFKFNKGNFTYYGGNMRIQYEDCPQSKISSTLVIESSMFVHGYDPHDDHMGTGTGLTVVIEKNCSNITVTINNITASDNEAYDGGNMALLYRSRDITNSVHLSNGRIENGLARHGGGAIHIWTTNTDSGTLSAQRCDPSGIMKMHKVFNLTNVTFVNNTAYVYGGAVDLTHGKVQIVCYIRVVTFQNCHFTRSRSPNIGPKSGQGHTLYIKIYPAPLSFLTSVVSPQFETIFTNCSFTKSAPISNRDSEPAYSGNAVQLYNAIRTIINNCTFKDNIGSAICASSSNLIFEGLNIFTNNSGINGGALSLGSKASIVIQGSTQIHFNNNKAQYAGGAIYARDPQDDDCFVLLHGNNSNVSFHKNTATFAGTAIYADIDLCNPNPTFDEVFHVKNTKFNRSLISSDPKGVCFCNDSALECDVRVKSVELYPGETIVVPATTVGAQNGTVSGDIHAAVSNGSVTSTIDSSQANQGVTTYQKCVDLKFTLHSHDMSPAKMELRAGMLLQNYINFNPGMAVELHLKFRHCPHGFTLNGSFCDCSNALKQVGVTCNISSNTLFRPTGVWIGYVNDSVEGTGVIVHPHCPFDYCKASENNMSLSDADEQCNYNRSGMLCGRCKGELSLALGSSKCIKCSDVFLTLLIAFAFAGVLLVFLLFICNLTVSEGTLNGLIFYANILWVNKTIFFPSGTSAKYPNCIPCLAKPGFGDVILPVQRVGCIYKDMATVCFPNLHLGTRWADCRSQSKVYMDHQADGHKCSKGSGHLVPSFVH